MMELIFTFESSELVANLYFVSGSKKDSFVYVKDALIESEKIWDRSEFSYDDYFEAMRSFFADISLEVLFNSEHLVFEMVSPDIKACEYAKS